MWMENRGHFLSKGFQRLFDVAQLSLHLLGHSYRIAIEYGNCMSFMMFRPN